MNVAAEERTATGGPDPATIIAQAISPYPHHHDGYRLAGEYVAVPFVVTAERPTVPELTRALTAILGFDLAEMHAGIGMVNAWTVSSFCGPDGLIAGIDLLTSGSPDDFYTFSMPGGDGETIPVHAMYPTLDASAALRHRWEIRDGAFVPFAMKQVTAEGPAVLTAALGIGIPADPGQARLFMEDPDAEAPAAYYERLAAAASRRLPGASNGTGGRPSPPADPDALPDQVSPWYKHARLKAAAQSVAEVGAQRGRPFAKILAGAEFTVVPEGHVGCSMAAVAYIKLAQGCVPAGGPAQLIGMSLDRWLAECPG
jgi:hypothetical protein